ncbi:IS630 family transposase [Micromonospora globispora]|uniref:IS630 family transposase n=1 Tax=Micromonospora globispora TaxID=1450148 RepID=UPI001A9C9094|nr:IS630 family transposase [Micromonospora globispora]
MRARIVLAAAAGASNAAIAAQCRVHVDTARKWRVRFYTRRLAGLADAARTGRPRRFTDVQAAQVKALACELPAERGVPLSRWSTADLADEAVAAGVVADISASTVARWLTADAIKPWRHRSWIFPRDPHFATKASRVLDLYARMWDGQPLDDGDFVISADEKTSIQARCRCHRTLPPGRSRLMRVEHEYDRGGALAYLAALDVHRGTVFGHCEPSTGISPFARLVEQVMTREPYASARRVFWIVDNGSSHRGQASIDRMSQSWPTTRLVHLPVHASWLNQIEIYFSIVQRKVVTPNDFYDLADVEDRLTAFQDHYNLGARPFNWRYTKKDLDGLLKRLATHGPLPTAA